MKKISKNIDEYLIEHKKLMDSEISKRFYRMLDDLNPNSLEQAELAKIMEDHKITYLELALFITKSKDYNSKVH